MKRLFVVYFTIVLSAFSLYGQSLLEESVTEEVLQVGTEVEVDSTLLGSDIFTIMPSGVIIKQSLLVKDALKAHIEKNSLKMYSGFRIRLYFNSSRDAREESKAVITRFNELYPEIPAYRSFVTPNFKVSAGNFRTRVDAEALIKKIKNSFPDAFIVRETFKYPSMGSTEYTHKLPDNIFLFQEKSEMIQSPQIIF